MTLWAKDIGAGLAFVAFVAASYLFLGPICSCAIDLISKF